jgi:hypothetical protein
VLCDVKGGNRLCVHMRALRKYAFLAWGPWRSSKPKLSQQAVFAESKRKAPPILPKIIEPPRIPEEGSPIWKNCAFLVDKPTGFTSHDVCAKLKVALNAPKIGHAGTLDMMATGASPAAQSCLQQLSC